MNVWDALWLPSLADCGLLLCCGVVGLLLRLSLLVVVVVFCGGVLWRRKARSAQWFLSCP
jgi:hypothetical protein